MINLVRCSPSLCFAVLISFVLAGSAGSAQAASSLTARFDGPVAGPGLVQQARLIVDYFPGNGEAVTGLRVRVPQGQLQQVDARRGEAKLQDGGFDVDYQSRGIGSQQSDTLDVQLQSASLIFELELLTNVDAAPYRSQVTLTARPPLAATVQLLPETVYAGETVEMHLLIEPVSGEHRGIDSVRVQWPAAVVAVGAPTRTQQGTALEVRQAVRVQSGAKGLLPVEVHAAGAGLRASPLSSPGLQIAAMPSFQVQAADDLSPGDLRLGEASRLRLTWHNDTGSSLAVQSLSAAVASGFVDARLSDRAGSGQGVQLDADKEKGSVALSVSQAGAMAAGQSVAVDVQLTPVATGPFVVSGTFQPADRLQPVVLGSAVIQVVVQGAPDGTDARPVATDLELARSGLEVQLRASLAHMPLSRGAEVHLASSRSDEGNWVVESLLTDLLLEHGVRVMADSAEAGTLHYRLADARVVYSPAGSSLNLLDHSQRRDARMEVFLRLEDTEGGTIWANRVSSRNREDRTKVAASWLGGAKGIEQVSVEPDHRAIEISLSGLIVGGLFFVFFAP